MTREFFIYFLIQLCSYAILTVNFRAVAQGKLIPSLASDAINASFAFFVIRRIAKSEDSTVGWLGYVLGSLVGTTLGLYVSR
jgi:hypothetical protein